jgi:hypothetical protein
MSTESACSDSAPGSGSGFLAFYREFFDDYVAGFRRGTPRDQANIELKYRHSLRVLDEARGIAASLDADAETADTVLLAALFHDIGRFPQYEKWRTFNDKSSTNHARLSSRVLAGSRVLADLPARQRRRVLGAVFLHNVMDLPPGLPRGLDVTVRVVRDADKLDIYAVMLEQFAAGEDHNPVAMLHLTPDPGRCSPEVVAQVAGGRMVDYRTMRWVNDFKLLLVSWLHGIDFSHTLERILERGYLDTLLADLPRSEDMEKLRSRLPGILASVRARLAS